MNVVGTNGFNHICGFYHSQFSHRTRYMECELKTPYAYACPVPSATMTRSPGLGAPRMLSTAFEYTMGCPWRYMRLLPRLVTTTGPGAIQFKRQ